MGKIQGTSPEVSTSWNSPLYSDKAVHSLSNTDKSMLDATAGVAFTSKTYNEAYDILEKVANNNTEWSEPHARPTKSASGAQEIDVIA